MSDWLKHTPDLPLGFDPRGALSRSPNRKRNRLLLLLGALALLFFGGRAAISYWVDLLWFRSLGYGAVLGKTWGLQAIVFAVVAAITFSLLYGAYVLLRHSYQGDLLAEYRVVFGGQPFTFSAEPTLRRAVLLVSSVVSLIAATTMMEAWPVLVLPFYARQQASGVLDPVFGKPLSFFLFTLPAVNLLLGWLLTVSVLVCLLACVFLLLTGGTQFRLKLDRLSSIQRWRGLAAALSPLLILFAIDAFFGRYQRLLEHHTIFDGVTYTDAHITLPGLLLFCASLVFAGVFSAIVAARNLGGRALFSALAPAVLVFGLVHLVGSYVSTFIVKPNELVREQPFIRHNIEMTRRAYGIDRFQRREFPADTSIAAAEPESNQATLQNIRLWDWHALQDTLRQVQEIRTYYDFPDIDIDRYEINGRLREVMLGTRELNVERLPESSRNWINEKLVYTHGYGVTMNPVNGFTPEGLPTFLLSNMPVQGSEKTLSVSRPEIYFGELTDTDVYVKTRQKEFDYPQGEANSVTSYQGTGGIVLGGLLRRVLLAVDRDDLGKLPFSDDVNAESRLLMRRNVRDRVTTLAPFLTFDLDPYMVVGDDGRLSWIMDAFTTSDSYPFSTHYTLNDQSINYMRNSVKVVIDAYDGTTTFYAFDAEDPILASYRRIFPTLFKDASQMPPSLRKHVRYPELLFKLQSEVYGLYHMTDPAVFFNREDLWTVATEIGTGSNGEQTKISMQPNFVLMKLPGESNAEFIEILPFTPANRNNLIGWLAGRSDGPAYGTALAYDFPRSRLVDGPQQIEARIDQNAQISGQLTLWNQQGSHVRRGSLLVIPSGRALLYAEPIYLQAQESPMPELRLVVLALQDRLAYGPTFGAALGSLFGGTTSSLNGTETQTSATTQPDTSQQGQGLETLVAEASRDFSDYQRLTSEGKLAEAGQKLDSLKHVLDLLAAKHK